LRAIYNIPDSRFSRVSKAATIKVAFIEERRVKRDVTWFEYAFPKYLIFLDYEIELFLPLLFLIGIHPELFHH
jgi:hypothetical protein